MTEERAKELMKEMEFFIPEGTLINGKKILEITHFMHTKCRSDVEITFMNMVFSSNINGLGLCVWDKKEPPASSDPTPNLNDFQTNT